MLSGLLRFQRELIKSLATMKSIVIFLFFSFNSYFFVSLSNTHNETENIINHKNYKNKSKNKNIETVQVSNYTNLWNQNKK